MSSSVRKGNSRKTSACDTLSGQRVLARCLAIASSFCSFWFAAPLRTVLSCGGARHSAPIRPLCCVSSSCQRMLYFKFGQDGLVRAQALNDDTFELARGAIEVAFEALLVADQLIELRCERNVPPFQLRNLPRLLI